MSPLASGRALVRSFRVRVRGRYYYSIRRKEDMKKKIAG
jgi:hypothetical protein